MDNKTVVIGYINWRGEVSVRHIIPIEISFKSTQWHPEEQWILEAIDIDKGENRLFAMKDILKWDVYEVIKNE